MVKDVADNKGMKLFTKNRGFSLVELMVVISIFALIASLALPRFLSFKIKAARAEMFYNIKTLATLAHAHRAENGVYAPGGFGYGIIKYYPGITTDYCATNSLGFATTSCAKLRYFYSITSSDLYLTNFYIRGQSYLWLSGSTIGFQYGGGGPPINISSCPGGSGNPVYDDQWGLDENGALTIANDAVEDCT